VAFAGCSSAWPRSLLPAQGSISRARRHIKALAIGIVVVVGIILLGRLADWFEERSFLLWLVFYLLAGGLTIAPFGAPDAGH
jgi:predicted MFS family arabinose efflux permease